MVSSHSLKAKQQATDRRVSANRKRWFRLIAVTVPLIGLVLLEFFLRAVGYGYPTSFFLKTTVNGQPMFIENQQFSRRYFPPGLERTPQPVMFPAIKPPDTIRIFVLGESAAMGDPEPAYGFPRILGVLLREAMPGKKIEVINAAVTAINSHVIREIAKDCADKQGDYWIIYMGKYADAQALARKRAELVSLRIRFEPLANPSLEPGLSLGGFGSEAQATRELANLSRKGVNTAHVVQERAEVRAFQFRIKAADDAIKKRLGEIRGALAGKPGGSHAA